MGVIEVRWRDWWPVLLIALGAVVILQGQLRAHDGQGANGDSHGILS